MIVLMPWADTRPIAGEQAWTDGVDTATWVAGIYSSWLLATNRTGSGGAISGVYPALSLAQWQRWSQINRLEGMSLVPVQAVNYDLTANSYLTDQGLHSTTATVGLTTINVPVWECIAPKRELLSDPTCVDVVDGGTVATLSGISYRTQHSQRRQWVLELLLDGPLDEAGSNIYPDVRRYWQRFLRRAELGVTAWLGTSTWSNYDDPPNSMIYRIGYGHPYAGCPNVISGAITDCTQVRWQAGADNKMARMQVTMTIAEVTPPGAL